MTAKKQAADTAAEDPKGTAVAAAQQTALAEDLASISVVDDSGAGAENVTLDDMALPFLKLTQALNDELKKQKSAYIEGLKEGDFFNSVTRAIYPGEAGLYCVPAHYERKFLEWGPERGDGFFGEHPETIMKQVTKDGFRNLLPNGNIIVPTATWYMLQYDPLTGSVAPAVVALASTQLKKSRYLVTNLRSLELTAKGRKYTPAFFYNVLHITSVPEGNKAHDWMGWRFDIVGSLLTVGDDGVPTGNGKVTVGGKSVEAKDGVSIYKRAKKLHDDAIAGIVKTQQPDEDAATGQAIGAGEDDEAGEEVPF